MGGAAGLAASFMALSIPGIGPIVAAGPVVAMLSGAGAGAVAGGLIGALTDAGVSEEHANYYAETVRRGGALVTVKVDESRADRAMEIMRQNGAIDLDERVLRWREAGWDGWNPSAPPYTAEEAERERRLYGAHADPLSGLPLTSDPERRQSAQQHDPALTARSGLHGDRPASAGSALLLLCTATCAKALASACVSAAQSLSLPDPGSASGEQRQRGIDRRERDGGQSARGRAARVDRNFRVRQICPAR